MSDMRTFNDSQGTAWQGALMEASYGAVLLLFSPLAGSDIRSQTMYVENMAEAEEQFTRMTDDELRALLSEAQPWSPGRP
ncbi:hypothetical protein ACMHYO_18970 [Allopusillimonas ginsengisoli]|uniref:hypothetical protein n=1 Tax=Allopusillimonas ginsengisoli TaxID=453575 RepID=UPI0010C1B4B1|nr:hypothetical protein D7I39_07455 [Allopusillimonas ginsengisoli]